jgi:hypothetical protein
MKVWSGGVTGSEVLSVPKDCFGADVVTIWPGRGAGFNKDLREKSLIFKRLNHRPAFILNIRHIVFDDFAFAKLAGQLEAVDSDFFNEINLHLDQYI